MKKAFICMVMILALLGTTTSAWARGGAFFNTLDVAHCKSVSPWYTKVGCNGYLQLRIIHGKDRNKAKSSCDY